MGYIYRGSQLCCDSCGTSQEVRKRKCPYMVTDERGLTLHYCSPSALCNACYAKYGGLRGLHGTDCRDGAKRAQQEYDDRRRGLANGEHIVRSAWGSWYETVPDEMVGVAFEDADGQRIYRLVPKAQYNPNEREWLSDYPDTLPWTDPPA